ncbi:MAG TPA: ATP-binding cassette domain-containing protein [Anaerolineae bacterium]|nr:ATP-binding cassette domain-containing protein [Anaerolineae bacterium]
MTEWAISTSELTRRFGTLTAVDRVGLRVPQGSVYGFLGPNGAGKTTTIRLLLGLIRAHGGEVMLLGQPLRRNRLALLGQVGALVEAPSLYPHLTGRENLELTRRLSGCRRDRIDAVLQTMRLADAADRKVGGYSSGMRQRLGLALALLCEPSLLVLDEPTNGLDPAGIREMREFVRRLPEEQGVTVFLSSHLLSEVEQVATHIGIIHHGQLLFQGPTDGLRAELGERVTVAVDRPAQALQILHKAGWHARRNGGEELHLEVNSRSDAAMLNALLVHQGLNVFHLSVAQATLEDVFLNLTQQSGCQTDHPERSIS